MKVALCCLSATYSILTAHDLCGQNEKFLKKTPSKKKEEGFLQVIKYKGRTDFLLT
jgi:hypothetical protein